ncbi:oxysterol-binding protein-related protein 2A-like isoform X1 [Iris pallida]|uniref:Oxysterol-binding protein-related protein 2A-like isoform X1 n=1 Tax=Iris pallida TaxID=29817 RepID=A0AAX6EYD8_IRIPA|nr:oxysterol-binding protein-related protein 2A-like isoform X1 [Iris pallida]
MRAREMHPLCCISIDCPPPGADHPPLPSPGSEPDNSDDDVIVSGVLQKWTHFGRGWRSRWFSLRNGVLTYYKIPPPLSDPDPVTLPDDAPRVIGSSSRASRVWAEKPVGFVHLKISAFRESKSDERRFYIFSPTKTLHLRTDTKEDRVAWIEALVSARSKFCLNDKLSLNQHDASFSTKKLRDRMHSEGLDEELIKDCEQIVLSEFSDFRRQLKLQYEEHLNLLGTFHQQLEGANVDDENTNICVGPLQLMKHEFSSSGHEKYSEYSTTESSDEVEKQDLDDSSDGEPYFFDSNEGFIESPVAEAVSLLTDNANEICLSESQSSDIKKLQVETEPNVHHMFPHVERRKKLPEPVEREKGVSLWSIIKDNVGKDLTRVCLPVYFNEPLSSLQKCFEDMEYSYLLDRAYEYGKMGNSLMRILNVAAFAVSGYACSDGRPCKPFNPLLGETYEADYPEKGLRFFFGKG